MGARQPRDTAPFRAPVMLRPESTAKASALPQSPTPLLGRGAELARLGRLLWESETRLITLIGPGGVGKTRLSLAAAERAGGHFADGAHFVDLAPIRDPALVPGAVAAALGVPQVANRPMGTALLDFLRDRDALLILDNCEQVVEAAAEIASWLAGAANLVILATSRAPLRIRWEQMSPVEPLALPVPGTADLDRLADSPAVALFVARAQAVAPSFALTDQNAATVAELCRRLDGLPLAIELVALQARLLTPEAILARLVERQSLPATTWGDLPARQRTIHDAIAWSYDLLSPTERMLFRRLADFVGGWSLDAAEAVCGDDAIPDVVGALFALVDLSLVRQTEGEGTTRFTMLETVREFAAAQLAASDEASAIAQRHADYFLTLAAQADTSIAREGEAGWVARLEPDVDNFRAALRWYAAEGQAASGLRLASHLGFFWRANRRLREGYAWVTEQFAEQAARVDAATLGFALRRAAVLACGLGYYREAIEHANDGLRLLPAAGDPQLHRSLYNSLGMAQRMLGQFAAARASLLTALSFLREEAAASTDIAEVLINLSGVAFDQGDYGAAAEGYTEAVALLRQGRMDTSQAVSLANLSVARIMQGDLAVGELLDESLTICRTLPASAPLSLTLAVKALLASLEGQFVRTAALLGAAEMVREGDGLPIPPAERPHHERMAAAARQALGEVAFAEHWTTGRSWSADEAITYALSQQEPAPPPVAAISALRPARPAVALSRREREVLQHLVAGHTNRQIADLLNIGERTVETHVAHIAGKLNVSNRVQIVVQARAEGLA